MTLPDVRSTRSTIAAMTYAGTDSIRSAAELRQRMAATVDLARRAKVDAREHLWNAREAERALGRMILAAREVGDLADRGSPVDVEMSDQSTLQDLGIPRDLAAHAVALARVPDEVWTAWHDWDADPTQGSVVKAAKTYQAQLDAVREEAEQARQEARRLADRKAEIERELAAVGDRAQQRTIDVPPLADDETAVFDADITISAAAVPEPVDDRDRVNGDRWLALMRSLEQVVTALDRKPPPLPDDHFADLTVLSARDLARRITNATAVWLRAVNRQYAERIQTP